ncbi:hypothetical protein JCM8547_005522 [Rhodosporidiobolus lusitaniae]
MSDNTPSKPAFYPSGHDAAVLKSHNARTAENSAAFLLPHLKQSDSLLDVGCGPGSITITFAPYVSSVLGVEHPSAGQAVLDAATESAGAAGVDGKVSFRHADALSLPFTDSFFDVVYCHQVLQHLPDPIQALKEMRRVSKRLVAAREADRGSFMAYPDDKQGHLGRFDQLWTQVARAGGGEPDAARRLKSWAVRAGFEPSKVDVGVGHSRPDVKEWGESWAERTVNSGFAKKAVELGLSTEEELRAISAAWREWGQKEDAWMGYLQGELLAAK